MTRYAIRQSPNIEGDIRRGWSAWMGERAASLRELMENSPSCGDLAEAWYESETEDYETFLLDYCDERGLNPMEDEYAPTEARWAWKHHDGLSCYGLEAETESEALAEGREMAESIEIASGEGHATEGAVRVVADLGNHWYLLECAGYWREA